MKNKIGYSAKRFRESLGLTQSAFARKTGLSETQVSRFENGKSKSMYILFEYMKLGFEPPFDPYTNDLDDGGLGLVIMGGD